MRRLFCLFATALACHAQIGDKLDRAGEVQKVIVPKELIPPAPVLSPAEALKSFKLQPGFRIEIAAAEPLIEDPVAAAFDAEGKLYVVEMRAYMPDCDGNGEDAAIGRVSILRDENGDGKMDKSTVFVDGLVMPRAIMPVAGGVLIGAPPRLYFCRDTNGDDKCDEKTEVASDYGVAVDPKRPELANPERAPNAPLWGLDNWIYSASYMSRFKYVGGEWRKALTIFRGQYGLSEDDGGRLYYNSNSDHLRCDVIPSEYIGRNPFYLHPGGANVKPVPDQFCWPARVNPGINRGYRPEMLRDYKLKEFTAACSPFIFYSDLFPQEFQGNAFNAEPAGNLVRRSILIETNGTVVATNAYDKAEFLASTDERFRPVNFCTGPDGALYVVDFHRGNIEHRISLTTYLRKQIEDRGLEKPIHLGRIFRIVPENAKVAKRAKLSEETPAQLVGEFSSLNGWRRRTAQRLLVEKHETSVAPQLKELISHRSEREAKSAKPTMAKVHALWTLDGLNALDDRIVTASLKDSDPNVRVTAIRLCERFFDAEEKQDVVQKLLALVTDSDPKVQLQLALTLGNAHDSQAEIAMVNLAKVGTSNVFLADAILTGATGHELELLEKIATDAAWQKPNKTQSQILNGFASCVAAQRKGDRVQRLLELAEKSPTTQKMLLDGIIANAATLTKKPVKLKQQPEMLSALKKQKDLAARVQKIDSLLVWPDKPGVKPETPVTPLSEVQKTRFENGKTLFAASCAACHQLHGMGMDGLAPPLVDSEWVLGSEQRLTRIVLHGLHGPLKVLGRSYSLDMPSMAVYDDEQIASILTYIRREWEHTAAPVEPSTVAKIRADTKSRQEAWVQSELLNVP